ncbi:uncharacterized protein LOC129742417 [Uranotaenia lowii]|uniref:uncharacterized protein LOC129742417 n=1 Tax=Uranotaenia lowii TaxID=190385 RepID=UPI002479C190|nr:uncharacterized protein LOC129742417 [Uranotaenia lowii]
MAEGYKYPCCDNGEDYDASVRCSECKEWFHFSCVNVDDTVENALWFCEKCCSVGPSIREKQGSAGQSKIRKQPHRAAKDKGSKENLIGKPKHVQVSKKDMNRICEAEEGEARNLGTIRKSKGTFQSGKGSDKGFTRSDISGSDIRSRKSGSASSKASVRDSAKKSLAELNEATMRRKRKEETQRKLLQLELEAIERDEEESRQRRRLETLAEDSSSSEHEESSSDDGCDFRDKVKNWQTEPSEREKCLKAASAVHIKSTRCSDQRTLVIARKDSEARMRTGVLRNDSSRPLAGHRNLPASTPAQCISSDEENSVFRAYRSARRERSTRREPEGPTRSQIAARQVYPRTLPKFSGRPQEWPAFISAYEQANRSCGFNNDENLVRIQEALQGKALETVRNRLLEPENVPAVIERLRKQFGNPEVLSTLLANRVQQLPGPSSEDLKSVIDFGNAVDELTQHLRVSKLNDHLSNPILMQQLIQKLPSCYAMQWVDFKRQQSKVNLETFSVFMENLADKALEVSYEGARLEEASKGKRRENSSAVKGFIHVADGEVQECCCHHIQRKMLDDPIREKLNENNMASTERPKPDRNCAVCGKPGHFGKQCDELRSMSLEDRWKRVQTLNLCPLCLYSHGANRCWSKRRCGINRCEQNHHPLLHWEPTGPQHVVASCNSHRQCDQSVMFRIVPVMLYNNGKQLETLALIDEGSSVTLIDTELARLLEADGVHEPLKMKWTNGISQTESDSVKFTLCISDQQQSCQSTLADVRTVAKLNLPVQGLDSDELKERFDYLQKIELPNYTAAAPKLLIGINNIHLIAPLESRIGEAGEPVAIRCKLGWTIYGPRDGAVASVQFIGLHHCGCDACCKPDQEMNNALKEFFQLEAVGISPVNLESKEDKRAREILERTTKRIGNRFETGLLWAEDDVVFPDSFPMAVKRWKSLQVRMDRISGISENIAKQLQEYVDKGYAHRITEEEIKDTEPGKAWYLPINYVLNPNKPGKVRIVWDAAAKVQGVSLNDRLLKGPDMISSLPSVINCFRERKVAFGGDIREMFHQIRIRSQDRQAQRFLFGSDSKGEPQIYVMDVVIFGASCSPCTSQYVKNLNGLEHAEKYPEASQAIMKKHFVDDYFDSADTEEEAIKRASEVREIHAAGGFEIRNWVSNSQEVLKSLGEISAEQTRIVEVNKTTEVERVLGVRWNSQNDVFVFSMNLREDLQPYLQEGAWPTKRIALKCIMSMFDPKQFLAPLLIHGRILMQDVWRSGIGWDEKLLQAQYDVWVRWTSILSLAEAVEVPRCYLGTASSTAYSSVQLHIFVDAGEDAYGSVAYFRFSDEKGVHCSFIEAKTKVAPLQYLSIPRKELQSATLGAQLAKSIKINHSFPIYKTVFWTDSKAVFSWIRSERRKYKEFVAHRVGQILEVSNPEDWRWVPTKDNAADDLTKWSKSTEIHSDSRWFRGPQFLYFAEQHWPHQTQEVEEFQEELRASVLFQNVVVSDGLSMRIGNVSKWTVLVRMVATVLRYMSNCKRCAQNLPIESLRTEAVRTNNQLKLKPGHYVPLRQEEYFAAENCLWRLAQREEYADEVATLLKQQDGRELKLERSSLLFDKSPFLDEFGVVRMEGRTERAEYA